MQVLQEDKDNVKALFRRGKAHSGMGHTDEALQDLQAAAKLAPADKAIGREIQAVKAIVKRDREARPNTMQIVTQSACSGSCGVLQSLACCLVKCGLSYSSARRSLHWNRAASFWLGQGPGSFHTPLAQAAGTCCSGITLMC